MRSNSDKCLAERLVQNHAFLTRPSNTFFTMNIQGPSFIALCTNLPVCIKSFHYENFEGSNNIFYYDADKN